MLKVSGSEVFTPFDHEAISLGYHPNRAYNRNCEQKVRKPILTTEAQLRQQQEKSRHVCLHWMPECVTFFLLVYCPTFL